MKTIKIPNTVQAVLDVLHSKGKQAYIVGGCVRDSIMGKQPKDWDVTTSATPLQVKEYFGRTIDTGIKHGTVTVLVDGEAIEVTTFRVDGLYEDHRRPTTVNFTTSLKEDVARRDFTVNAMAYSHTSGLVDYFEGQKDIEKALIRCVGKAEERFEEDALRMMRAIRFASVLNFTLEENTAQAILRKKHLIRAVSQERIRVEFLKTLQSNHPDYISYFQTYGLSPYFLPEIALNMERVSGEKQDETKQNEEGQHFRFLKELSPGNARLVILFAHLGSGKAAAAATKKILKRMTFDNHTIQVVSTAIEHFGYSFSEGEYSFRKLLSMTGKEVTELLLEIAMVQGKIGTEGRKQFLSALSTPYTIRDLAINGEDLIGLGITEGKKIGDCLKQLLEAVLTNPQENQKEILLNLAKHFCEK